MHFQNLLDLLNSQPAIYYTDQNPTGTDRFLSIYNNNHNFSRYDTESSIWLYSYGNDYYYGSKGTDTLGIGFDSGDVSIRVNHAGVYEIETPNGIIRAVDFEYLLFNDGSFELAPSIADNWYLDAPPDVNFWVDAWNGNDAWVYHAGNDLVHGYPGNDSVVFDFRSDEVSITNDTTGALTFITTPTGVVTTANVENLYFIDQTIHPEPSPYVGWSGDANAAITVDMAVDYWYQRYPGGTSTQILHGDKDQINILLAQEFEIESAWTETLENGNTILYLEQSSSSPFLGFELIEFDYVYFKNQAYDFSYGLVLHDDLDPITGILNSPGRVNLNNNGVTPFTLFGSDEINVDDIELDSLLFGGKNSTIGVAQKKNNSFFASYEDVNGDEFLDLLVKVETSAFAGVIPTEPFEVFGSLNDGTRVIFGLNEGESINFIA